MPHPRFVVSASLLASMLVACHPPAGLPDGAIGGLQPHLGIAGGGGPSGFGPRGGQALDEFATEAGVAELLQPVAERLIASNAGKIVANNAGGIVANNAGGIIGNNAGGFTGYRVLAVLPAAFAGPYPAAFAYPAPLPALVPVAGNPARITNDDGSVVTDGFDLAGGVQTRLDRGGGALYVAYATASVPAPLPAPFGTYLAATGSTEAYAADLAVKTLFGYQGVVGRRYVVTDPTDTPLAVVEALQGADAVTGHRVQLSVLAKADGLTAIEDVVDGVTGVRHHLVASHDPNASVTTFAGSLQGGGMAVDYTKTTGTTGTRVLARLQDEASRDVRIDLAYDATGAGTGSIGPVGQAPDLLKWGADGTGTRTTARGSATPFRARQ